MNTTGLKYAAALVALAICSACAGGSGVAPSTGASNVRYVGRTLSLNGRLVTAARLSAGPRYATLVPDVKAKHEKFEYIFNYYGTYASIFDYPKSVAEIGRIAGDGGQGCTNVLYGYGKHIMWNMGGITQMTEYRVPKTPIKTLVDAAPGSPSGCAMDTSGDLAVGIMDGTDGGAVVIYKNASGSGTVIRSPLARAYFDGYDTKGNLFIDGLSSRYAFQLDELPKGSSKFKTITTSNAVKFPGSVQWDGKYMTVFDQVSNATYQYTISGTTARLKSTISYTGSGDCAQTWIVTGLLYCADSGNNGGEVFKYPAGGSPVAVFTGSFDTPLGTTAVNK